MTIFKNSLKLWLKKGYDTTKREITIYIPQVMMLLKVNLKKWKFPILFQIIKLLTFFFVFNFKS